MTRRSQALAGRRITPSLLLALLACVGVWGESVPAAAETVRVLVAENRPAFSVASSGGLTVTDTTGRHILAQRADGRPLRLAPQRGNVLVREMGTGAPILLVWPGRTPTVGLDGQPYRGRLEIHPVNGSLLAVDVVELEEYLQGVLKDEIPPGWPAEAIKAMAVTARTYAVYRIQQDPTALFNVRATTASQVYGGAADEDPRTTWAVQATRGQILTINGEPIPAFYHSCSGGATEDAQDVFGLNFDTVFGVRDDFSLNCPYALWIERLTASQIETALRQAGYPVGRILRIQDLLRSRTGRIVRIAVQHSRGTLILEGKRFREALGNDLIRSTDFAVRPDGDGFTFVGRGWGHGVGLSQWGAKEMADLAYQYQNILKFYFPLAQLRMMNPSQRR